MSNNTAKDVGAKRKDMLMIDPADLVVVTDPAHELFDERALDKVDPRFKESVKRYGVKEPILIRYNGKRPDGSRIIEVVDGRQRVRAALELNEENGWTGDDRVLVPCVVWQGTEKEATLSMVVLNEARKNDDVWVKAQKAKRLMDRGATLEDMAVAFQRSEATVERWLRLFECSKEVIAAVEHEGLTVEAALKLTDLPRAEQAKALEDMRAKGELVGKTAVAQAEEKAARGKPKKKQKRARPFKDIEKKRRDLLKKWKKPSKYQQGVIDGICFALGDDLEGVEE